MDSLNLLANVSVLEIAEGVAGPMCGKVLADLGATVAKIEPPQGDWLRHLEADEQGSGATYQQLNAGKKILALDLSTQAGQDELRTLVRSMDVCIIGQRQSKLAKLGLTYLDLKKITPTLIYCHVSGWGTEGPMGDSAASELCVQVAAGLTRYLGVRDGEPVRQGFDLVSVNTGIATAQAALAAFLWREQSRSCEGQFVEVSMLATAVALMQWNIAAESGPDAWKGRQLCAQDWPPDHGFQCADTRCLIDLQSKEEYWPALLRDIGYPDLADDPRFNTPASLYVHARELPALTVGRLMTWSFEDLEKLVREKYDGTIVPVLSLSQVMQHPQVRHIGVISAGEDPRVRFPMEMK